MRASLFLFAPPQDDFFENLQRLRGVDGQMAGGAEQHVLRPLQNQPGT